jgi:hypothetical protein
MFTLGQQHRFVATFATALFNLKKADRGPLHIVFDEAHEFLPQMVQGNEAEMVGAVRRLSKMGRNFGIGVSLISPRPAEVNKGSVNLTERMYCGRLKGPQDRKAIEAWASTNDADTTVLEQLPLLPNGDLIAWTAKGPERVRFLPKRTFDASKTPEAGDAKPAAKLPDINLAEIREAMAATIEEAKANDPKVLHARIAELERIARGRVESFAKAKLAEPAKRVEVSILTPKDRARLDAIAKKFGAAIVRSQEIGHALVNEFAALNMLLHKQAPPATLPSTAVIVQPRTAPAWVAPANDRFRRSFERPRDLGQAAVPYAGPDEKLPKGAREMLAAIATSNVAGMTRRQVATLSGIKVTGGTFAKYLGILRGGEYLTVNGDQLELTDRGRAIAGDVEIPRGGSALLAFWEKKLPAGAGRMLRYIVGEGIGVDDETWAQHIPKGNGDGAAMERSGGTWQKYKGILVTRGLVRKDRGLFYASDLFFN